MAGSWAESDAEKSYENLVREELRANHADLGVFIDEFNWIETVELDNREKHVKSRVREIEFGFIDHVGQNWRGFILIRDPASNAQDDSNLYAITNTDVLEAPAARVKTNRLGSRRFGGSPHRAVVFEMEPTFDPSIVEDKYAERFLIRRTVSGKVAPKRR